MNPAARADWSLLGNGLLIADNSLDRKGDGAVGAGERVGREDGDRGRSELRLALFDAAGEGEALLVEGVEDAGLVDGSGLLALDVDDSLSFASEDGDVGALSLTGPVDDTSHDRDFHRGLDGAELVADLGDQLDEVDLDAATGGAGDELGLAATAQAQGAKQFDAVFDFKDGVGCVGDADGVADTRGQECPEGGDGAYSSGFGRPGVGQAEVQRQIEALGRGAVGVDDDGRVDALEAEDHVMEIVLVEDADVVFERADHQCDELIPRVFGDSRLLGGAALPVGAIDDASLIDADADGQSAILASGDDAVDVGAVLDVSGVEADFVDAMPDGFQGPLVVVVHIGDDGDRRLLEDGRQGVGVAFVGDGHTDQITSALGQLADLCDGGVDIVGERAGHGLHGDGGAAPDGYAANLDLVGGSVGNHCIRSVWNSDCIDMLRLRGCQTHLRAP